MDYEDYLLTQLTSSWKKHSCLAPHRTPNLAQRFFERDQQPRGNRSVLCVGCRNSYELNVFQNAGFGNVVGIDLFSTNAAILQMDMHVMRFPDQSFDVIFACHSLEHSYDPGRVLKEFARVIRHRGVCIIEVPIRFRKVPTRADLQDFGSLQGLLAACDPFTGEVLFAEESPTIARLIFRVADREVST
jgi:SAM-dependent methyltransferase